jgi:hypothetical protein
MIKTDNPAQEAHEQDVADDAEAKRLQALYDARERAVDSLAKAFDATIFHDWVSAADVAKFAPTVNDHTLSSFVGPGGRQWPQREPFVWECLSEGVDSLSGAEQAAFWQTLIDAAADGYVDGPLHAAFIKLFRAFAESTTPEVQE